MTDEEAVQLGQEAIYHATFRDAYSGGMNQVYVVKEDGWTKVKREDVLVLRKRFMQEKLISES